jgi:hypothetical protein
VLEIALSPDNTLSSIQYGDPKEYLLKLQSQGYITARDLNFHVRLKRPKTYPAIMTMPPRGVIGPRALKLHPVSLTTACI